MLPSSNGCQDRGVLLRNRCELCELPTLVGEHESDGHLPFWQVGCTTPCPGAMSRERSYEPSTGTRQRAACTRRTTASVWCERLLSLPLSRSPPLLAHHDSPIPSLYSIGRHCITHCSGSCEARRTPVAPVTVMPAVHSPQSAREGRRRPPREVVHPPHGGRAPGTRPARPAPALHARGERRRIRGAPAVLGSAAPRPRPLVVLAC